MPVQETCSAGGPVVVLPAELASSWGGVESGDYGRACYPRDHRLIDHGAVGWVSMGQARAIVLDLELMTAYLPTPSGGVILRNYADDTLTAETARTMLGAVDAVDGWAAWGEPLPLVDGRLFMFDAACPGASDPAGIDAEEGVIVASPGAGRYAIHVAVLDGVELIRLQRLVSLSGA